MHPTCLSAIDGTGAIPLWAKLCALAEALNITMHALTRAAEGEAYGALWACGEGALKSLALSRGSFSM
jgi:hypothetical protein